MFLDNFMIHIQKHYFVYSAHLFTYWLALLSG